MPGRFKILDPVKLDLGILDANTRFFTTVLGEHIHSLKSLETGRTLFSPFNGSRNMPEAKEEAAPVGVPGRTTTWILLSSYSERKMERASDSGQPTDSSVQ